MTTTIASTYFITKNIPIAPFRTVLNLTDRETTSVKTSKSPGTASNTERHSILGRDNGDPSERQPLKSQPSLKEPPASGSPLFTKAAGSDDGKSLPSLFTRYLNLNNNKVFNKHLTAFSSKFEAREGDDVDNDKAYRDTVPKPLVFLGSNISKSERQLLANCHRAFETLPTVETEHFSSDDPKISSGPEGSLMNGEVVLTKSYMRGIVDWMEKSAIPLFDDIDTIKLAAYIRILKNVITNTLWEERLVFDLSIQLVIMRETLLENISNAIKQLQGQFDNPNEDYYVDGDKVVMIETFDEPEHILAKAMNKYYDFGYVQANGFAWVGHCCLLMACFCAIGHVIAVNGENTFLGEEVIQVMVSYLILVGWGICMYAFTFLATLCDIVPVYVSRIVQLILSAGVAGLISSLLMGLQGAILLAAICLMSYSISLVYKIWNSSALCGVYVIVPFFTGIFQAYMILMVLDGFVALLFWSSMIIGITFTVNFERAFIGLACSFKNFNKFTWTRHTGFASMGIFVAPILVGSPITAIVFAILAFAGFIFWLKLVGMLIICICKKCELPDEKSRFSLAMDAAMLACLKAVLVVLKTVMTRQLS